MNLLYIYCASTASFSLLSVNNEPIFDNVHNCVTIIAYICFQYMIQNAGLSCTDFELLEEWNEMVQYAVNTSKTSNCEYTCTWYRLFNSPRSAQFQNILLAEAIFCLPVSSAACERCFSVMKRVKTERRCSFKTDRLEGILRIIIDGPPVKEYDVCPALGRWARKTVLRPRQKCRHRDYPKRKSSRKQISTDFFASSSSSSSEESEDEESQVANTAN